MGHLPEIIPLHLDKHSERQVFFPDFPFANEDSKAQRGAVIILWEADLGGEPRREQVATLHPPQHWWKV